MVRFLDLFPPPKFLNMTPVGLAITDSAIRFVEFKPHKGDLRLKRYAEKEIPAGIVSGGYIHNAEELTRILGEFVLKNGFHFANVTLPEEKSYLFKTSVPKPVKGTTLRDNIEFKIEENVPLTVDQAVFDYSVIKKGHNQKEDGEHVDVVVSVLPIKMVSTYVDVLQNSGVTPLSFQVESQAVSHAVVPKNDPGTYMILNLGKEKTGLYVVRENIVHFASTFVLNRRNSKEVSGDSMAYIGPEQKVAHSVDESWVLEISNEISKLSSYWNTHGNEEGQPEASISKIIVCGDGEDIAESIRQLSPKVSIPVEPANVWVNAFSLEKVIPDLPFVGKGKEDFSLKYASAIGLAMCDRI